MALNPAERRRALTLLSTPTFSTQSKQAGLDQMAPAGRLGPLCPPLALLLPVLLVLLLLLPPPVAAQQQQQQQQQEGGTVERLYRFPLCLDGGGGGGDGGGCTHPQAATAAAPPPNKLGGVDGGGSSSSDGSALSAPGAGAVLAVAWDPRRPGGGGYVLREERRMGEGQGQDGEGVVLLANATALEGEALLWVVGSIVLFYVISPQPPHTHRSTAPTPQRAPRGGTSSPWPPNCPPPCSNTPRSSGSGRVQRAGFCGPGMPRACSR